MRQNIAVVSAPTSSERKKAFMIIGLQAVATMLVILLWTLFNGAASAVGAVLGGLAYLIPALFLTWAVFAVNRARAVRRVALILFGGELLKLLVSAVAIAVVILCLPELMWPTLTGFLGAQAGYWLAPFFIKNDRKGMW